MEVETMTKIVIIDDHPLVCDGIKTMLKDESSMEVVNASKTAAILKESFENYLGWETYVHA